MSGLDRVLVLVPTYDERENLPVVIGRIRSAAPDFDVVVIDDNSPDGTGEVADRLAADDERVHVLHRRSKEGLGPAYLAGFAWGLDAGYDVLIEMDADGSHPADRLPAMVAALDRADVVIGSRWVRGGRVVNWPLHRKALSVGGNLYTRLLLGMRVHDATAGFRAHRATALVTMGLDDVASHGYCFQVDLTRRAVGRGLRVVEIPITFVEREVGESKMSGDIVRESLLRITTWGLRYRAGQLRGALPRSGGRWHEL